MFTREQLHESFKALIEAAREIPTEKIAVLGLIVIGALAIHKEHKTGGPNEG